MFTGVVNSWINFVQNFLLNIRVTEFSYFSITCFFEGPVILVLSLKQHCWFDKDWETHVFGYKFSEIKVQKLGHNLNPNLGGTVLTNALHKKSFPLRISPLNVAKSAVSCRFGQIYWINPWWKTFFMQCICQRWPQ